MEILVAEPGPAFCAAPGQNNSAGPCSHSHPKSVSLFLVPGVGLVGTFHRLFNS